MALPMTSWSDVKDVKGQPKDLPPASIPISPASIPVVATPTPVMPTPAPSVPTPVAMPQEPEHEPQSPIEGNRTELVQCEDEEEKQQMTTMTTSANMEEVIRLQCQLDLEKMKMQMQDAKAQAELKALQDSIKEKEKFAEEMQKLRDTMHQMQLQHVGQTTDLRISEALKKQEVEFAKQSAIKSETEIEALKKKIPKIQKGWYCTECFRQVKEKKCDSCKGSPNCVVYIPISTSDNIDGAKS
jgi:hypothetical protein